MSDQFAQYVREIGLVPLEFDIDREKPNTLSFQLASYVGFMQQVAATVKAQNKRNEPLRMHVGVTGELNGNAFASSHHKQHYIGITFGHFLSSTYFSLQSFFMTRAFEDMGNPPGNHASRLELCPRSGFWEASGADEVNAFFQIQTDDKVRVAGALFLNYAMTMIALHHEYYHVLLGHCAVLHKLGLHDRLLEVGENSLPPERREVRRAFEAEADQNAIILLIQMILKEGDLLTGTRKFNLVSVPDKLRLMLVAAGLLTTSWFSWQSKTGYKAPSHPNPGARFLHFYVTTKEALEALGQGHLFKEVAEKAITDIAQISVRCSDLTHAMMAIAKGPSRTLEIVPVPEDIRPLLEEEAFTSA
ncbi:MAG: hypothetical protein WCD20_04820 [Rhodomicrobium sp.]